MRPYRLAHLACLAALIAAPIACSDSTGSGGDDLTFSDLVGTWNITQWEYTSKATQQTIDMMDMPGATASITIQSNGRYTLSGNAPGLGAVSQTGSMTLSGTTLTVTPDGEDAETAVVTLQGDTFTLFQEDASNDFGTGEEPATMELIATRA